MDKLSPGDKILAKRWPVFLGVAAFLAICFFALKPILAPFVAGALLAYFGDPIVDILERRRINRTLGVAIVFAVFTLLMTVLVLFTLPRIAVQIDMLVNKLPLVYQWFSETAIPRLRKVLGWPETELPVLAWGKGQLAENWQSLGKLMADAGRQVTGSGVGVLAWLANLALVPVVAFYLMRDWDILVDKAHRLLPVDWQQGVSEIAKEAHEVVGAFLRGQLLVMLALSIVYGVGLWIVGVNLAVALGAIAGLASIVPYLGFVVGISASLVAAYAQFGEWHMLLWVVLVFGVGQLLESVVLTPILVGDRIGLHPVAVVFALMAGGQLAGFVGVLVALPVAAVLAVFARHAVHFYRSSDIYAGRAEAVAPEQALTELLEEEAGGES